jgi:serpin B
MEMTVVKIFNLSVVNMAAALVLALFSAAFLIPVPRVCASEFSASAAVNSLAPKLYRTLSESVGENENIFFSPLSISTAFAMTFAGASGETAAEMKEILGLRDGAHESFGELQRGLATVSGDSFLFLPANSIWPDSGYKLLPSFENVMKNAYGAEVTQLDYKSRAEESRKTVNDWVEAHTSGKIKDILPPQSVNADTRLILANAIYFRSAWLEPFRESATYDADFFGAGGKTKVRMMRSVRTAAYYEGEGYQAIALPYAGEKFIMTVILPKERDGIRALEEKLDAGLLSDVSSKLVVRRVDINLPKFKTEHSFDAAETLGVLGVKKAFDRKLADFSLMSGNRDIYIGAALHKARIETDENGSEAAAATAVVMPRLTAAPGNNDTAPFIADHPFIFFIQDKASKTMLFTGRMARP